MTTTPLTLSELPALRALAEKATPGPWKQHLVDDTCVIDHHGNTVAETFPDGGKDDDIDYNTNAEQKELDAAFIAAARDALPRALDMIEAQAREIAALREALRFYADIHLTPNEGPWGSQSTDFGTRARAALDKARAKLTPQWSTQPSVADIAAANYKAKGLERELAKARAALASARNDALEEAAKWHDRESLMNRAEAGQRGRTDGDYWHFEGRADQHQAYAAAIRAMKRERADD